ncbi:MAG: diguanylate cyclase [Rubrivivax sp.]|nr:MAG: diguanylate cyclase [Rubrivivax sp.]
MPQLAARMPANDSPAPPRGGMAPPLPQVDSLTAYNLRVARLLAQCRRDGGQLALLWVEVATLAPPGHALGEAERESMLHSASQRLRNRVRSADEVQRVGDHCFAVLLVGAGIDEAALVERRLLDTLRGTYGVDGRLLQIAVRMGTAVFPDDGRQGAELAGAAQRNMRT